MEVLDEQLLNEMTQIGSYDDYVIYVRSKEGPIPHVHIVDKQTLGYKYNCCVRLDEPMYFSHGSKQDTLNSKAKKEFIKFITEKNDEFELMNWEVAVRLWNISNPDFKIRGVSLPDYTRL